MTEPSLGTLGEGPSERGRDPLRFNQLMGLFIILGAIGAIVWLTLLARSTCSDADVAFVAYVPGVVEVRSDTRVEFFEQCVGRIVSVEPGLPALQVQVERSGALGDRESLTVSGRDPERTLVDGQLSVHFDGPTQLRFESGGTDTWTMTRRLDGQWDLAGPPLPEPPPGNGAPVRSGTLLGFEGVRVQWADVARFTRIAGTIDESAFQRIAENVGLASALATTETALGAGTAISVGSRIGIGTSGPPQVRLEPSYSRGLLVADRAGVREFSPEAGSDVLGFLGEAVEYLSSPGKSDAPPINRYERMIDDFNGSLSEVRAAVASARRVADTLAGVADAGGDQFAGRLVIGQRQLGVLESALNNIDSVLSTVEANVTADPDEPLLVNLLFDDEQAESLDQTLANVRGLSDELRNGETPVFTRIAGEYNGARFDSIVARTDRLSVRANDMLDGLEESGGSAAKGAKIYGIVTALAQALSTIAVIGIWR